MALIFTTSLATADETTDEAEDARRIEWFWFPFPMHSPETDWALTFSAIAGLSIADGPHSNVIASASWSQNDQKSVAADAALNIGSAWRIDSRIALEDWPTHYYGLGNDTNKDDEEVFDAQNAELTFSIQRQIAPDFWLGPQVIWRDHGIDSIQTGGLLDLTRPPGVNGVTVGGAGLIATFDTRDDLNAPESGQYVSAALVLFGAAFGSDYTYRRITVDARQFVGLRPGWVLAFHQHLETTHGRVPFQELPQLGDSAPPARLRGHITGRFRDHHSLSIQSELRFPIRGRLGGVVFAGAGDVVPGLGDLSFSNLKWSGGAGLRFRALREQRINLRLDVARASDETGVYFSVLEAF